MNKVCRHTGLAVLFLILLWSCGERSSQPKALAINLTATDAAFNFLPPNDIGIPYSEHRVEWQLTNEKTAKVNSITAASDKEIALKLNPTSYRVYVSLLGEGGQVLASSRFAQCQNQQHEFELVSGANTLPVVVCTNDGNHVGLVENRAHLSAPPSATTHSVVPKVGVDNFGFNLAPNNEHDSAEERNSEASDEALGLSDNDLPALAKVLAFGDSGTGGDDQKKVAAAMQRFCKDEGCNYGVMLGDNIYEAGVSSPDDPQFKSKFEDIYRPLGIPFYLALGNHDEMNHAAGIQGQIGYSNISPIWHMPDRYYKVRLGEVEYFVIDTNTFSADDEQIAWLKSSLSASTASWKVVFGHHPMYTVGAHGMMELIEGFPIKHLRKVLDPLLCQLGADLYLSGHDHHLEVNQSKCGVVNVLSGAAAKTRETYAWLKLFNKKIRLYSIGNTLGFAHLSFYPQQVLLKMVDANGEVLFQKSFANRKN